MFKTAFQPYGHHNDRVLIILGLPYFACFCWSREATSTVSSFSRQTPAGRLVGVVARDRDFGPVPLVAGARSWSNPPDASLVSEALLEKGKYAFSWRSSTSLLMLVSQICFWMIPLYRASKLCWWRSRSEAPDRPPRWRSRVGSRSPGVGVAGLRGLPRESSSVDMPLMAGKLMCAVKKLCSLGGQQWGKVELQSPREPSASVAKTRISHGRRNDLSISPFRPVMCAIQNTPNIVAHFLLPWTKRAKVKRQAGQSFFFFFASKSNCSPFVFVACLEVENFSPFFRWPRIRIPPWLPPNQTHFQKGHKRAAFSVSFRCHARRNDSLSLALIPHHL